MEESKTEQIWMDEWHCNSCEKTWRQENRSVAAGELCIYCGSTATQIDGVVLREAPLRSERVRAETFTALKRFFNVTEKIDWRKDEILREFAEQEAKALEE